MFIKSWRGKAGVKRSDANCTNKNCGKPQEGGIEKCTIRGGGAYVEKPDWKNQHQGNKPYNPSNKPSNKNVDMEKTFVDLFPTLSNFHDLFLSFVPAVGAGTNSSSFFPADSACRFFHISVHEGRTTKFFPVFYRLFYFSPYAFTVLFSFFSIALLCTPTTSLIRMPFETPFRPCRQSR